ncbi:MAG: isocitrate/isopropylmalate dehydrogenase family protein [Atribacterota bacterium]|jgi:3-isopropylmalate dehydrogenase|nr:isocitrate/isopropylmalate dehydrogenase family protein [Atribacterota bacterium]
MYNIALIPGDGIGPEVIQEGKRIVDFACQSNGIEMKWHEYPFGAEYYLKTGILLPDSVLDEIKDMDAIYFGAVGDPAIKPGILEKEILLKIRFFFDQYINLRPVKLFQGVPSPLKNKGPEDIDFYVIRENTEDFYIGTGGRFNNRQYQKRHNLHRELFDMNIQLDFHLNEPEEFGYQLGILSKKGSERIMKYAFDFAERKKLHKVSTVDKVNVLSDIYQLWRDVFKETAANYPMIETDYYLIDAMTMFFVSQPERFKVIVSPNMFGDIITDLGSTIQGGIGMAAGANINPEGVSMFEPIHGSAPDLKNKFVANPIGTIIAGAMMMEELGENETALTIENAVMNMLKKGTIKTVDMGGNSSTKAVSEAVINELAEISKN